MISYNLILKRNGLLVLQYGANAIIPLICVPKIISIVGLEKFGGISLSIAFGTYLMIFVQYIFNLTGPVQLNSRESERHGELLIEIALAKGLLLGVCYILIFIGLVLSEYFGALGKPQILVLLVLPIAGFLNFAWYLQCIDRMSVLIVGSFFSVLVSTSIAFFAVKNDSEHGVFFASLALVATPALTSLIGFIAVFWDKAGFKSIRRARPIAQIAQGGKLFASQVISLGYTGSGVVVISVLSGSAGAGAYAVVERLANMVIGALQLVHTAAYPQLVKTFSNRSVYFSILKLVVLVHSLCTLGLTIAVLLTFESLSQYFFGGYKDSAKLLIPLGLVWVWLGVFGIVLTGYFAAANCQSSVLGVNSWVLFWSVVIGLPGTYLFGAAGWLTSIIFAQSVVIRQCFVLWNAGTKD